ncbi:MFS transporter [Kitasatospora sp. NPDC127059]|uniref:MFS transporter n=1 Tax=unclassified Kitasatospora TaxID=2633591 RepID=UPI003649DD41
MFRALLLGLGALSIGTDAYLTAGLLPDISHDLHGSMAQTGQLVTAFTLCYALLAPLLGAALGRWNVRTVLLAALSVFTLANAASALAPSALVLLVLRGVAGAGAGVFMPVAATAASALAGPERRARALAIVLGGLSSGTVLGVPAGLLLAGHLGWRVAFWLVTALGAVAWAGTALWLPRVDGAAMPGLRARAEQLRDARVGLAVAATFGQTVASLGLYTYLVPLLNAHHAGSPTLGLWLWGLGGVIGSIGIGPLLDRLGRPGRVAAILLVVLALTLLALAAAPGAAALPLLFVWGAAGWAFVVPQQHRLLDLGPTAGAGALALNSSATYLGGAVGAAAGGAVLAAGTDVRLLPVLAAAGALGSLLLHTAALRLRPAGPEAVHPIQSISRRPR